MDFFDLVTARRSMRKFAEKPVEEEKLIRILEAADRAPSGGNLQGYEIYIVRSLELRQALAGAALDQNFLAESPLVLVFCTNPPRSAVKYGERGATLYALQDATIACAYAQLAAKAQGLDTVWVGAFDEQVVSQILQLPREYRPVAMLPIGYAGREPGPRPRRGIKDLVHEVNSIESIDEP